MERTRRAAAGVETGDLEGNVPGQESGQKVVVSVKAVKGRDRGPRGAEVVLTPAPEEIAGIGLEAGRGGGRGREGTGREGEAEAGEEETEVEVVIEREIGLRDAIWDPQGILENFWSSPVLQFSRMMI